MDIGKVLRPAGDVDDNKTYTTFLSQGLALKLEEEFPLGLTIEELNWLQYDMGYDVMSGYRTLRNRLLDTEAMIKNYLQSEENIQKRIEGIKHEYTA